MTAAPAGDDHLCSMCAGQPPYEHAPECPYANMPNGLASMTSVAAPLLAGFTITLTGVVSQASERFAFADVSLFLLLTSAICLTTCVQAGFWAQRPLPYYRIRPWRGLARISYDTGIMLLFCGISVMIIPPPPVPLFRWISAAVAASAAFGEIVWSIAGRSRPT